MLNNFINSFGFISGIGPLVRNPEYVVKTIGNIQAGNNDVYTVPSGRKAIVLTCLGVGGTGTTVGMQVKVSGTYYPISASPISIGSGSSLLGMGTVLEAGDILSVNGVAGGNTNCRCWFSICEMDISSPFYVARNLGLSNGDNTIYTVPTGKTAYTVDGFGNLYSGFFLQNYFNNSGASRNITAYVVPTAGSPSSANTFYNTTATADGGTAFVWSRTALNSGDSLVINTNSGTSGQTVWVSYIEL